MQLLVNTKQCQQSYVRILAQFFQLFYAFSCCLFHPVED
jgi:hypothetical protein